MVNLTILGEDVLKNQAKLRELELKLDALVGLMEKEGVLTRQELEVEFSEKVKELGS